MFWFPKSYTNLGSVDYQPDENPAVLYPSCEFCDGPTHGNTYDIGSQGRKWDICLNSRCWKAADYQKDRIYNGLVDCMQTRKDVLRWMDDREKVKK